MKTGRRVIRRPVPFEFYPLLPKCPDENPRSEMASNERLPKSRRGVAGSPTILVCSGYFRIRSSGFPPTGPPIGWLKGTFNLTFGFKCSGQKIPFKWAWFPDNHPSPTVPGSVFGGQNTLPSVRGNDPPPRQIILQMLDQIETSRRLTSMPSLRIARRQNTKPPRRPRKRSKKGQSSKW